MQPQRQDWDAQNEMSSVFAFKFSVIFWTSRIAIIVAKSVSTKAIDFDTVKRTQNWKKIINEKHAKNKKKSRLR